MSCLILRIIVDWILSNVHMLLFHVENDEVVIIVSAYIHKFEICKALLKEAQWYRL